MAKQQTPSSPTTRLRALKAFRIGIRDFREGDVFDCPPAGPLSAEDQAADLVRRGLAEPAPTE